MKFLFKLIFGLLIFVIVTVVVPVAFLYFSIKDKTDNTPKHLYSNSVTLSSELTTLFDTSFDLEDKEFIDLTFTEDAFNRVIFAIVRDSMNPNYLPDGSSTNDEQNYIKTIEMELPVLGKKKILVKSIYADIKDNKFHLYVTMDLLGLKTRGKLIAKFSETADEFKITFESLGMGKADLVSGLAGKALKLILSQAKVTDEAINKALADQGLPFEFRSADFSLNIGKDEINEMLGTILDPDDMDESSEKTMMAELLNVLTSKENDLVDFGVFGTSFGLRFDLKKFFVDASITTLPNNVKTFDKDAFVKNKVQSYVISGLSNPGNSKMVFTNLEFNQILYDQSNGYDAFKISIPLPNTNSTFDFEVLGILLDFNANDVDIRINVDLNGLITSMKIKGQIQFNNTKDVMIFIQPEITLGEDVNEASTAYIKASSDLILSLLSSNIEDMGMMQYSATNKAFILSADSFTQLMAVDGTNQSPLVVDKIKIVNDAIEVYTVVSPTDPMYGNYTTASDILNTVLENNPFVADDFDTEGDQGEVVTQLLDTLDEVASNIAGGTLNEEHTNQLIESIQQLSPQNQQAFLQGLQDSASSPELEALYDSLFGN